MCCLMLRRGFMSTGDRQEGSKDFFFYPVKPMLPVVNQYLLMGPETCWIKKQLKRGSNSKLSRNVSFLNQNVL